MFVALFSYQNTLTIDCWVQNRFRLLLWHCVVHYSHTSHQRRRCKNHHCRTGTNFCRDATFQFLFGVAFLKYGFRLLREQQRNIFFEALVVVLNFPKIVSNTLDGVWVVKTNEQSRECVQLLYGIYVRANERESIVRARNSKLKVRRQSSGNFVNNSLLNSVSWLVISEQT